MLRFALLASLRSAISTILLFFHFNFQSCGLSAPFWALQTHFILLLTMSSSWLNRILPQKSQNRMNFGLSNFTRRGVDIASPWRLNTKSWPKNSRYVHLTVTRCNFLSGNCKRRSSRYDPASVSRSSIRNQRISNNQDFRIQQTEANRLQRAANSWCHGWWSFQTAPKAHQGTF